MNQKKKKLKNLELVQQVGFSLIKMLLKKQQQIILYFQSILIEENLKNGRRNIKSHTITIPTKEIKKLVKKYKIDNEKNYSFYFWINPKDKTCIEWRNTKYNVSKYLDKNGFSILQKE